MSILFKSNQKKYIMIRKAFDENSKCNDCIHCGIDIEDEEKDLVCLIDSEKKEVLSGYYYCNNYQMLIED